MKRKINVEVGGRSFSFVTDESKEKVQKIKDTLIGEFEKYKQFLDSNEFKGIEDVFVLLLLNHISKEISYTEKISELEDRVERLLIEIERGKAGKTNLAG